MDSQGGAFAFDMNMDFSNMFAAKPNEGNTSNGFFFGDEGIDATATGFGSDFDMMNPALLTAAPQEQSFISQNLTMDDTLASTSMWTTQLTPQSQPALNSFPPTPVQSFETMYEQPTTLGKRALQLDVEDFPQAKRHEAIDYTSMFSPSSSWTLDTQMTPPSAVSFGLSDEAADMCAMWFNKYAILPSDRHINSLSQLTGEPADAIRHWFGRLLKQGMGSSNADSAYKSQTALAQQDQFWNDISTDIMQVPQLESAEHTQEALVSTELPCTTETATAVQPANALRGGKKQRCSPTDDRSLLSRDPNKIYQCTRKCGKRYGRKCDWKRNEEEGYPCKSWVCSLCISQGADNVKACFRKYHFAQHFRNIHPGVNCDDYEEASIVCSETEFPRQCGFCKHRFETRQERIDHIADHFKQGKCMLDWNDEGADSGGESDDSDDSDDRPNGDGSDSDTSSYQPPDNAPHGGSNAKFHGGSNNGGGADGGGSGGGFFQFHISQLAQHGTEGQSPVQVKQRIIPHEDPPRVERHLRASSEPLQQRPGSPFYRPQPYYGRPGPDSTAKHDQGALAGDAIPLLLTSSVGISTQPLDELKPPRTVVFDVQTENDQDEALRTSQIDPALKDDTGTLKTLGSNSTLQLQTIAGDISAQSQSNQLLQTVPANSLSFVSVKLLGAGGFSTVDEVIHRDTNLRLSRKTLKNRDSAATKELLKEVNVLQKLRHPHVIRFLGAYSKGDKMSILLSPVADTTLALWLDQVSLKKPANLAKMITTMFGCLASSVRYLHEQRPVVKHMDIKPQNVLVVESNSEYPHVVLCDFGISSSDESGEAQMQPLTRHYIAPEVLEGSPRKQAADIWSLGCVFTEMASVPFSENNDGWLQLRQEFSGRKKHYWQDASGLQDKLAALVEQAATPTEATVIRSIKTMLNPEPAERPDAASLTFVFTPAPCCLSWPNEKATYPGPHEELNAMQGLLQNECKACEDQHGCDQTATHIKPLSSAKEWLDQCSHTHEACRPSDLTDDTTLPTRLVDIIPDDQDKSFVRVVDSALITDQLNPIRYIALSHAWTQSHATLSQETQQAMEAHLPKAQLSQSLNSAITTAQDLGYKYIWVDSLCVLQDNPADKERECTKMASVFRNAVATLVLDQLDSTSNEAEGDHRLEAHQHSCIDDVRNLEEGRMRAAAVLPAHDFSTPAFGWDTRAWALQERLLSHRFLHLCPEQMYWECNELKASTTFPQGLSSLVWEKLHTKADPHVVRRGQQDTNATRVAAIAKRRSALTENPHGLSPTRLRDCQWIKKQGDGIGDSMEAAQTSLKVERHGSRTSFARRALVRNAEKVVAVSNVGDARTEIGMSGQMDQNGSLSRVNGKVVGNANGSVSVSGENGNANGIDRREDAMV